MRFEPIQIDFTVRDENMTKLEYVEKKPRRRKRK